MPRNLMARLGERMSKAAAKLNPRRHRHRSPGIITEKMTNGDEISILEGTFHHVETDEEKTELHLLRELIREQPNVFLLNNLLLSIQLFSHYEKEIATAREIVTARENELNKKLQPTKVVMLPDVLYEHFTGRIRFTSFTNDEPTIEPLRPIKMYVAYDNVLVTELDDARHYSSPAELRVNYTFVLKEATHTGYVRLEQTNSKLRRGLGSDNTDLSSIAEMNDEIYSEDDGSVYGPTPVNGNTQNGGSTSMPDLVNEDLYDEDDSGNSSSNCHINKGRVPSRIFRIHARQQQQQQLQSRFRASNPSSASSSSSGYTTTTNGLDSDSDSSGSRTGTRRPSTYIIRESEIPAGCFKRVTYTNTGKIYTPPREPQKPLSSQQKRILDAKLRHNYDVVYVNGYNFAHHFEKLFKKYLAKLMEFDSQSIEAAKRTDATIRLEKIDYVFEKNYVSIEQYEVMPCFLSPWPRWAHGLLRRARPNGWPTDDDLRQLDKFTCYLVPESLIPKDVSADKRRIDDPLWKLDWYLSFPAAERYLETCLSQSQMTVYVIALMMHKIFIKRDTHPGLEPGHIRNMVFWMVQRRPDWSEFRMGEFMLALINVLHKRIKGNNDMRDYFMEQRNLFANVNLDNLLHSQKQLKRIMENPVMFIFHTMEKIEYENNDYPRMNYQELYRLLTLNELKLINPHLDTSQTRDGADEEVYSKREKTFWDEAKEKNTYYMKTRKSDTKTLINPRQTTDSIIDIQEKCEPLTEHRLALLLIFFSEHFIKMACCCNNLGATRMKRVYLEQARLLAIYLANDIPDYEDQAKQLLDDVRQLRDSTPDTPPPPPPPPRDGAPETPRRNADPPLFVRSFRDGYHSAYPPGSEDGESTYGKSGNQVEVEVYEERTGVSIRRNPSYQQATKLAENFEQRVRIDDSEARNSIETTIL